MGSWESFGGIIKVYEGCNSLFKVLVIEIWEQLDIVVEKGGGIEELNMEKISIKEVLF